MFYAIATNYVRSGRMKQAAQFFTSLLSRAMKDRTVSGATSFVLENAAEQRLYVVEQHDSMEMFCRDHVPIQPTEKDWVEMKELFCGSDDGRFYETAQPLSPAQILAGVPGKTPVEKSKIRDAVLRLRGTSA